MRSLTCSCKVWLLAGMTISLPSSGCAINMKVPIKDPAHRAVLLDAEPTFSGRWLSCVGVRISAMLRMVASLRGEHSGAIGCHPTSLAVCS